MTKLPRRPTPRHPTALAVKRRCATARSASRLAMTGLVVDGAGRVQAANDAQHTAASAARAATNQIHGNVINGGRPELNETSARTAAEHYLNAAGMTGTATIHAGEITVTATNTYETKFLSLIGIQTLTTDGHATARLITGPEGDPA